MAMKLLKDLKKVAGLRLRPAWYAIISILATKVYFGRFVSQVPRGALVLFPCRMTIVHCGLAGIVAVNKSGEKTDSYDLRDINRTVDTIAKNRYRHCMKQQADVEEKYLGGHATIESLLQAAHTLKGRNAFYDIFTDKEKQATIESIAQRLETVIADEAALLDKEMGHIETDTVEMMSRRLEDIKDAAWCFSTEITQNINKIKELCGNSGSEEDIPKHQLIIYKHINTVLNSIDRLEVRGRDSAGISLMFILEKSDYQDFQVHLNQMKLIEQFQKRNAQDVLINGGIAVNEIKESEYQSMVTVAFTFKVAAEIGRLGDNIRFLRKQIKTDRLFRSLVTFPHRFHTVSSHTRWASVGAITEANCHPVDNQVIVGSGPQRSIIHVCLNGDIDNYLDLMAEHQKSGIEFHKDVTTDTKIIPLQVEKYIMQGFDVEEAFRRAVNDFQASHAISMHTDLAPGKLFLAQKGSGQTLFIGLSKDLYMPTSEVYGFVEETQQYIKMNGEKTVRGKNGDTQGQLFILDQETAGGLNGIRAMYYDGTPLKLQESDIRSTEITSRDIDRQSYAHYFLKEISESPSSVEKTLQNRWKVQKKDETLQYHPELQNVISDKLHHALTAISTKNGIQRIYFVGQGTAGVAATACADILNYYLKEPSLQIRALKASELSGFSIQQEDSSKSMTDALVIAISQSGTTTDTNRAVDMVRERGAHTLAIVNRRDSDITFKVDGVVYTSSGRDIEMSVASTKAFYSQIVAGAILGLYIAELKERRDQNFITEEIKRLLDIPEQMQKVLANHVSIGESARRWATKKTHWAVVGSGPNKASADEIRIKLSELCYKTISTDYVEDKKHIDLSAEPLIIICAAGTRATVIGDIIKDTAIFKAHKATPIVIASEGESRFEPYAEDVFYVPPVNEHLAPIFNTLVGHIWGYYAALAINEGSKFLYNFQSDLQNIIKDFTTNGMDIYELLLEKQFKEKIVTFYSEFRRKKSQKQFPDSMGLDAAADLTLLLKYLSGRLPVSDFEIDFGSKGTPLNMLNRLFGRIGECINIMARPVDAIKHQAKTVTVGTSRISEQVEGILFDTLADYGFKVSQLTTSNIIVLKNLQKIVADIMGAIRYRIDNLNLLGEPTMETTIEVERKDGVLAPIPSRVETDTHLKGTKRIIVRQGNVYIGKGRKDDRSIIVIPTISTNPETPNIIENLLLLNVGFRQSVSLATKIKALGGKYEHISSIVQENNVPWNDDYLEMIAMDELFGRSAEKIGEFIVSKAGSAQ
jgi:glucosamine--fructose-6-phosphate aminotransferase (isomerizing)